MLIIIPNKCLMCKQDIGSEKQWGTGLVQMHCEVNGFPPFRVEATLSWCSVEHFLKWWEKNLNELNVTITEDEAIKGAIDQSEIRLRDKEKK